MEGQKCNRQVWCGIENPTDIFLYVLELEGGKYYVGLTLDVEARFRKHAEGKGAEWTKLHRPIRVVMQVNTGLRNQREAEAFENQVTVECMASYGKHNVRGGHFSFVNDNAVDVAIWGRGAASQLMQHKLQTVGMDVDAPWSVAIDSFLDSALEYYDEGGPEPLREVVFAKVFRLTRYAYWRESFSPCLSAAFWGPKGVLPVLLSFKLGRPVASKHKYVYDVLASAMSRGRNGLHPHRNLYLKVWQAYDPQVTNNQVPVVARLMQQLNPAEKWDHQFNDGVSVFLPETRQLLRCKPEA